MKRGRKPAPYTLYLAGRNSGKRSLIYYYQVRDHAGKLVQRSTGCTSKGEAQKYMTDLIETGHLIPVSGERVLFEAFADPLFDANHPENYFRQREQTRHPITQRTFDGLAQQYEKHVRPYFQGKKLADITKDSVKTFGKQLESSLKDGTICLVLKSLSLIFDEACKLKILTDNPAKEIISEYDHIQTEKPDILTDEELTRFLAVLPEPHRSLHEFASSTGARIGECLAIQVKDIPTHVNPDTGLAEITICKQFSDKYGLLDHTKGKKSRRNFIGLELLNRLQLLGGRFNDPEAYLFSDNGYTPLTESKVRHHMTKALKLAGITKHIKFHAHRHYANTNLLASGLPKEMVQLLIGHSNGKQTAGDSLTRRYTNDDTILDKNITNISNYLNKKAM